MKSFYMLWIVMALLSVGIVRCDDPDDGEDPEEVVETDGRITITKDNAEHYIDIVIDMVTLQDLESPQTFTYTHEIKLKPGVICVSQIQLTYEITFEISYQFVEYSTQETISDTTTYLSTKSQMINFEQDHSEKMISNGWNEDFQGGFTNYLAKSITYTILITGGRGEVILDVNYQPNN